MYILVISAYYHDSAACILKDGVIFAAAQEERWARKLFALQIPKLVIQRGVVVEKIRQP